MSDHVEMLRKFEAKRPGYCQGKLRQYRADLRRGGLSACQQATYLLACALLAEVVLGKEDTETAAALEAGWKADAAKEAGDSPMAVTAADLADECEAA